MFLRILLFLITVVSLSAQAAPKPLRVAVAGLVHGHVEGFLLRPLKTRTDVSIVGIYEPNVEVRQRIAKAYNFPDAIFFDDLNVMLDRVKPDAVATFTNPFDHAMVVEACASHRVPVMMEKPMAVSNEHARRIQAAAQRSGIAVFVNYETSWYPSHGVIAELVDHNAIGDIRKMVAMDGHAGPKAINVRPEFFDFLTDPKRNGAGALFDFGCYGANLMTWLMHNQRPVSVTASALHIQPAVYPNVDDDATILVEYPKAQGIIQGSWNWPFARKDFEVYGATGYAIATGGANLRVRLPNQKEETRDPAPLPPEQHDPLSYLVAVARGMKPAGLSSLENNMIAVEILDAARESVRTGKKIVLK